MSSMVAGERQRRFDGGGQDTSAVRAGLGGRSDVRGGRGDGVWEQRRQQRGRQDHSARNRTAAATTTTTTAPAPAGSGSGTPSRKPCDLLTKDIAETALGVPVAPAKQTPGQANETCSYRVADKSSVATVFLTTYAAKGTEALLDAAAAQFTKAYAVDGVGDAARVSLEDHAIGVLKGDVVIAIGLIPPSNGTDIAPVTEAQLVNVAKAVVPAM